MPDSFSKRTWIKNNTTFIGLKLNNNTDYIILDYLKNKPKQTEIKRLLLMAIAIETCEKEQKEKEDSNKCHKNTT